jgi:transposase-like protein
LADSKRPILPNRKRISDLFNNATTNTFESLNSVIRKATNARKIFPNDQSAMKVVYLAIENASKKWSMPLHDWKPAINQFMIMYQDRMPNFN